MKIVIPTAGFGTRLRPHTWSRPKPLISVAGKAVLGHVLDMFAGLPQVDELIFIVGYLGDQIEAYVAEKYPNLKSRYVQQPEMRGQSHAIWLAREGLTGPMLMVFVDTLIETDISRLASEPAQAVTWVKEVPDPRRFGVAKVDSEDWVVGLVEKPDDMSNNLAVVGFYYFDEAERLIAAIEEQMARETMLGGEFYLADAVNIMLEDGLKMRVERVEVWIDAGKPDALLETNRYLLDHGRDNSAEAEQRPEVAVIPPVFIDPQAQVRRSVIGPHVSLGPGCVIEDSLIRDSIVEARADIRASSLTGSLIGRDTRVRGRFHSLNIGDNSEVVAE